MAQGPVDFEHLRIERDGAVSTVTLDRTERHNALDGVLLESLRRAAESFRDDAETRVVVFAGAGDHFSAGADLRDPGAARPATRLERLRQSQAGPRMLRAVLEMDAITIAAVHGVAAGGAACLATACDFHIGSDDCRVSYPEVPLGMSLSWTALPLCVHLIGPARAKRMVILGRREEAATLLDWGFLDRVVPRERLLDEARAMATEYAAMPPLPAQMVKRSVNAITQALDRAVMHMDMDQLMWTHGSEDFREGVRAFFEKRPPKFSGD